MFRRVFTTLILAGAVLSGTASAQSTSSFAAVQDNQIVVHGAENAISIPDAIGITSLSWSQHGQRLAVIATDAMYEAHLWAIDGSNPVMLQTGRLESGFPV